MCEVESAFGELPYCTGTSTRTHLSAEHGLDPRISGLIPNVMQGARVEKARTLSSRRSNHVYIMRGNSRRSIPEQIPDKHLCTVASVLNIANGVCGVNIEQ